MFLSRKSIVTIVMSRFVNLRRERRAALEWRRWRQTSESTSSAHERLALPFQGRAFEFREEPVEPRQLRRAQDAGRPAARQKKNTLLLDGGDYQKPTPTSHVDAGTNAPLRHYGRDRLRRAVVGQPRLPDRARQASNSIERANPRFRSWAPTNQAGTLDDSSKGTPLQPREKRAHDSHRRRGGRSASSGLRFTNEFTLLPPTSNPRSSPIRSRPPRASPRNCTTRSWPT